MERRDPRAFGCNRLDRWGKEIAIRRVQRVARKQEADPEDGIAVAEEVLCGVVDQGIQQKRRGGEQGGAVCAPAEEEAGESQNGGHSEAKTNWWKPDQDKPLRSEVCEAAGVCAYPG